MAISNPTLTALMPRGFRNANPGNIEDGPFARKQPGYKGSDGRFAIFDNMENGVNAQSALLNSYGNSGLNTLNAIVNRYAPPADNNNTAAYTKFLSTRMGIAPDAPLDMSNPSVRRDLALAMGEHENGKDPRSFMALGSDSMPQVGGDIPNAPIAPQSITLGDQENQQPLNNIGSTLANMGASIASLDNRGTGIASLNASRVASNLAQQEQQRAAEGGWKYAGQTQNGQGLMFQNSKGEIRVEPLAPGFAGNKSDETSLQKDYAWAGGDADKMKLVEASHGIKQKEPLDPEDSKFWADYIKSNPQAMSQIPKDLRPQVMHDLRVDADAAGFKGKDLYETLIANRGNIADDVRRSQIIGTLDTYKGEFLAGAKQTADYARDLPHQFRSLPLEKAYQWAETNAGSPEATKINNLRVAIEGLNRGFNRSVSASSNGNVSGEKRVAELLSPNMPLDMILGGIKVMTGDVTRLNEMAKQARDNQRARNAGKPLPYPDIEDEEKAIRSIVGESKQSKDTNSSQNRQPNGAPQSGDVIDGFRFKGGDPSKQENWEKQ